MPNRHSEIKRNDQEHEHISSLYSHKLGNKVIMTKIKKLSSQAKDMIITSHYLIMIVKKFSKMTYLQTLKNEEKNIIYAMRSTSRD